MSIKIAIIDIGISKELKKYNIKHFYLKNNQIVEGYKKPLSDHGDLCLNEILKQNVDFEILDININEYKNGIKLDGMILAIQKAIDEHVDIINISLGTKDYSTELYDICQKAMENNIIIISAAAHIKNEVSYPASLENVLCVKVDKSYNRDAEIKKLDNSTVCVNVSTQNEEELSYFSTSFASAYFSGYFAKCLKNNSLYDKFAILQRLFDINLDKSKDFIEKIIYKPCPIYDKLKNKKVAVVILPYKNIKDISNFLMLKNIVAFFDHDLQDFVNVDNPKKLEKNFEIILVINSSSQEAILSSDIEQKFKNYEIICLGNFKNNTFSKNLVYDYKNFASKNLSDVNKPIVLISGLSNSLNKFDVQINLAKNFQKNNIKSKSITYNPEGVLYGFDIFNYPEEIIYPNIVCATNRYMFSVESLDDFNVWLINIAGGNFILSNQNKNLFGKLVDVYFDACNVDIFILCINNFINLSKLNNYMSKLKSYGIKYIFLVFSHNAIQLSSLESQDDVQVYKMNDDVYERTLKILKENLKEKIFSIDDVKDGKLYKAIIGALTS